MTAYQNTMTQQTNALEWIACRCEAAVSVADCKTACEQCAKLAREELAANLTGELK